MNKIHLVTPSGGCYCNLYFQKEYGHVLWFGTNTISQVTCKRCLKRFYGVPFTKKYEYRSPKL